MSNLHFVIPRLAVGGDLPAAFQAALSELAEWQRLGITHVVDNRLEWTDEELVAAHAPSIRYLHNGTDDAGQRMPHAWFDRGVAFIAEALANTDNKVLVHCHMGINRGPSLAFAALLHAGWDPIEAITAIRRSRSIAGVGYAEDALEWHHDRISAGSEQRTADRRRLRTWRAENWIDVRRIIRDIRTAEAS